MEKGICVELDQISQIEYNRKKNVEQDNTLKVLSSQVKGLLEEAPAGFLQSVYYGLTSGANTNRIDSTNIILNGITGNVGDSFEIYDANNPTGVINYVPAIIVKLDDTNYNVVIKGDYPSRPDNLNIINMRTGESFSFAGSKIEFTLMSASSLSDYPAQDNQNKQITVLNDLATNRKNVVYASVDINLDDTFNWVSIGQRTNGANGFSVISISQEDIANLPQTVRVNETLLCATDITITPNNYVIGDVLRVIALEPFTVELKGNIRGEAGADGIQGVDGAPGVDGITPSIIDGFWYLGDTNTGVKAVGIDGTNGADGKSFTVVSGLWSVPSNVGKPGNVGPDGSPLNTLPTLPRTGITGLAATVYDPLTTPLDPEYLLYFANDNDTEWTVLPHFNGQDGAPGKDGATPYIQDNNWYINGVNTGVPATGPQGPAASYEGTGQDSIAIGTGAEATQVSSIAIGTNAKQNGVLGVALGSASGGGGTGSICLGANAKSEGNWNIQLGQGTNATDKTLQIKDDNIYNYDTHTMSVQNLLVNGASVGTAGTGLNSVAIGTGAEATKTWSVSIGYNTKTRGSYSVCIGSQANDGNTDNAISIGNQSNTSQPKNIAIGAYSNAGGREGVTAIGYKAIASGYKTIQLGEGTNSTANTLQICNDNIYNHKTHTATFQNLKVNDMPIGPGTGLNSVAIGIDSQATGNIGVAIGNGAKAGAIRAIQLGEGENATGYTLQVGSDKLYDFGSHQFTKQGLTAIYPIGIAILGNDTFNPNDSIGGTWTEGDAVGTLKSWTRTA